MDGIRIGMSGASAYGLWMDTIANNVANADTARPAGSAALRPQEVVMRPNPGGGVRGAAVASGDPQGVPVYQPDSPLADAEGTVRYPDVDPATQLGSMVIAQRGYQASLAVIDHAREAYDSVLRLGRQ